MNRLPFTLCIGVILLVALMVACTPGGQPVQTTSVSDTATAPQTPSIAASTELPATPTETPQLATVTRESSATTAATATAEATATKEPTATTEPGQTTVPATATVEAPTATSTPAPVAEATATSQPATESTPSAGFLVCDRLNAFSLWVPEGWAAHTPPPDAVGGVSGIWNYDMAVAEAMGGFPPGALKIEIMSDAIQPNSFDTWVVREIERARADVPTLAVTEPQAYALANYTGVTFTVSGGPGPASTAVWLQVRDDKVLRIGLLPADSPALSEGLSLLSTLRDGECEG